MLSLMTLVKDLKVTHGPGDEEDEENKSFLSCYHRFIAVLAEALDRKSPVRPVRGRVKMPQTQSTR